MSLSTSSLPLQNVTHNQPTAMSVRVANNARSQPYHGCHIVAMVAMVATKEPMFPQQTASHVLKIMHLCMY
jgi:hypothetical protein